MSKKLIALLILFLITLSVLIFTKLNHQIISIPKPLTITSNSTQKSRASLSLLPNPIIATATTSATLDVTIDSNQKPDLIQLELSYDPNKLYNLSVLPGNYFISPEVGLSNIDYKNGRISYALNGDVNPNSNIVARITFNSLIYGVQENTAIYFLPKTIVKQNGHTVNLDAFSGATITLKPTFYKAQLIASPSATLH